MMGMMSGTLGWFGRLIAPTTWDSSGAVNVTFSNGNLTATNSDAGGCVGTNSKSSGKYYFEITVGTVSSYFGLGVADATWSKTTQLGIANTSAGYRENGQIYADAGGSGSYITGLATFTTGAIIGVAVDVTNHLIYWAKNNTWLNSANPSSGTSGIDYFTTAAIYPAFASGATAPNTATINVGHTAFSYTPPSGFSAWG